MRSPGISTIFKGKERATELSPPPYRREHTLMNIMMIVCYVGIPATAIGISAIIMLLVVAESVRQRTKTLKEEGKKRYPKY